MDYINHLELYFMKYPQQTYLDGSFCSLVDVCIVQLLLATIQEQEQLLHIVPPQVYRWCQTTIGQLQNCFPYHTIIGGWRQFGLQRCNIWETWTNHMLQCGQPLTIITNPNMSIAVPPTTAPVVPVASTTTTTATTTTTTAATSTTPVVSTTTTTTVPPVPTATTVIPPPPKNDLDDDDDDATNPILIKLQESKIPFELYNHVRCMTVEELVSNVPLPNTNHECHTKNLFLRDKKHGYFLVTLHASNTIFSTKGLTQLLQLSGKVNLRLADADLLWKKLQVKPGCIGPLCMVNTIHNNNKNDDNDNKKENITLVLDQALFQMDMIHSHALRNNASVKMTPTNLQMFLKQYCHVEPIVLDFGGIGTTTTTTTPATTTAATPKTPATTTTTTTTATTKSTSTVSEANTTATTTTSSSSNNNNNKKSTKKGETLLALQWKKSENFASWYTDVIVLSEMISYYDVSGCYILRPWSYKMWELIQEWFNDKIQALDVENAYFPLFVSQDRLEREKDHVEGFAPEVAWVTKSGSGDLAQPIAIRPTSETIMYPAYSDWIQSHRDLPLKLNQWSNVVRWEFKYPTPFLRTREFLWQEGHTAHATFEDANTMVMDALDLYRRVYEDLLAVPVIPGYKTEKEKFAGGYRTTTVEAYIAGSGRAIQGATSHHLGQNFGTMFDITYQNEIGQSDIVWQTSWGLTTRTIGVMVMVHGDNIGLVLPPRIAPIQIVIVPIFSKKFTSQQAKLYYNKILKELQQEQDSTNNTNTNKNNNKLRIKYDDRTIYNPGWKYNHWEQKGVPIRIEIGPRDVENQSVRIVTRYNGIKQDLSIIGLGIVLHDLLYNQIQVEMYNKAKQERDLHIVQVTKWDDFVPNLELYNLILTPWCGGEYQEWEDVVKEKSRQESLSRQGLEQDDEDEKTATSVAAKTLCIPFDQPKLPHGTKCIISGMDATCWVLWGRSY